MIGAGTRLGQYEIRSLLGAGGMGVVYRARDTKLGRDVAIEVLPAGLASDPDRRSRLEREARLLASINSRRRHRLSERTERGNFDVRLLRGGDGSVSDVFSSQFDEQRARRSPDNRAIAVVTNESGRYEP